MSIKKSDYPKTVSGTMILSEDTQIGIPEIEIDYDTTTNSKGERKVSCVSISFPSRKTPTFDTKGFSDGKIVVDYNSEEALYRLTLYSVESMVDTKTGIPLDESDVETFASESQDIELVIFIQIALQYWGALEDTFPIIDMCGHLAKITYESAEEHGFGSSTEDPETES